MGEGFARRMFRWAAIYGVIVLLPLYLAPVPLEWRATHFGFVGCALVFQWVFWLIGSDPVAYRPFMVPAVLEKLVFAVPALGLAAVGAAHPLVAAFAIVDVILGAGFFLAWRRTAAA